MNPDPSLTTFDHSLRTRLIFGLNSVERAGELVREFGARRVLLVTDPGIVAAGHAGRVQQFLQAVACQVTVFDQVRENPTTDCVDQCVTVAAAAQVDTLIALGGGSSLDTAKGCNFLLTNGGRMQDYWGTGKATRPMLPFVAIPTTAGTGSECQSYALISDAVTHQKMACGDPKATARIAILDPQLTLSQPGRVTALTGVDTLTHAVETAVTKKRNPLSLLYAHEAFRLTVAGLPTVLARPDDIAARSRMLLGAAFAGIAIENSMLGATHSAANPLTAHFGLIHGQAVGLMLPHVIRFNAEERPVRSLYADLARTAGIAPGDADDKSAVAALLDRLERILNQAQIPNSLTECGVEGSQIPLLAIEASKQWTAGFNPRTMTAVDFERLYSEALTPRGKVG